MAPIFKTLAVLSFTLLVAGQGQFITGPCANDAACTSGCCNFRTGLCAAPIVAKEAGDSCGFGSGVRNDNALNGGAAPQAGAAAPVTAIAPGTQFVTGVCTSDADCQQSCCGFNTGKCAGPVIAQTRDGGCGFGNATPNDIAAKAFLGQSAATTSNAPAPATGAIAPGTQFVTGPCTSDVDCQQSCCGFNTGKCAGPVIAQTRDGGCGFGNATPNDIAAKAFLGQRMGRRGPAMM